MYHVGHLWRPPLVVVAAQRAVVDAALSTVTGASFIASTVFRVIATRKLVM